MICDHYISPAATYPWEHVGALTLTPSQLIKLVGRQMRYPDYIVQTDDERKRLTVYIGGVIKIDCHAPMDQIVETICKFNALASCRVFDAEGNPVR